MLRITQSTSSAQAKWYYTHGGDYYLDDLEEPGTWHGKAAARLGLSGEVGREQWEALCDNLDPSGTGKRLTQRTQKNRRVGYDFTFDVPKSVSLLYALTRDERLMYAFRQSVDATMAEIESELKTRVRAGKDKGADGNRTTSEAVWGSFLHYTTRPEDGIPDPHCHLHVFVHNVTWDSDERRWKAAQFGDIKRDAPYFQGLYQTHLAERLSSLGLPLERTKTGYEIAGVHRSTLRKVSRRTERIERVAREKGITNPKERAQLGARTRHRKSKDLSFDQLAATWRSWLTPEESGTMLVSKHRLEAGVNEFRDDRQAARDAIQAALDHHLERASVVPERRLLAYAFKQGAGNCSVETLRDEYARCGVIYGDRDGQRVVTTREILEEERRIVEFARDGRGTCRPLGSPDRAVKDKDLKANQLRAARYLLSSPDRVMLLRGYAGSGKTRLMREVIAGIEEGGRSVFTFAPSSGAGRGVLREEVAENANTVAYLLKNEQLHEKLRGQTLWLDEAGQIGTKTLRRVFELAESVDCRVILGGDVAQHGAVERGAAMRLLESEAGLVPAELGIIRRQQGRYRDAVQSLADGYTEAGFNQLKELGWVHEVKDGERYQRLASDYADALAAGGDKKNLLVISPTHKEGARVTQALRQTLKATGQLGAHERHFTALERVDLTAARRADPTSYRAGDVLVYHQNAKGHRRGDRLVVGAWGKGAPLHQADRFQVFRPGTVAIAEGDRIRITAGGSTLDGRRLNNGDLHTVKSFTPAGHMVLENGELLAKEFGHITHGWVTTSYASQGKTVQRVFLAASRESHPACSAEMLYVSASRGTTRADVYTDKADQLLQAVKHSDERLSATELVAMRAVRERTKAMQRMRQYVKPTPGTAPRRESERERVLQ